MKKKYRLSFVVDYHWETLGRHGDLLACAIFGVLFHFTIFTENALLVYDIKDDIAPFVSEMLTYVTHYGVL